MKRFTLCGALLAAALSTCVPAFANGPKNSGTAIANNTINACLQAAKEPGYMIVAQEEMVSVCFFTGNITRVDYYKTLRCNDNKTCPKPAAVLVASAEFGCEGELVSVICY